VTSVVVNGRFLRATPTGLHRVARSLLDAAMAAGLDAELVTPPESSSRLGAHLWEQVVLPRVAGERPVLSLVNTAPVFARHGVVLVHDLAPLVGPHWFSREMRVYGQLVIAAARRAELVLTVSDVIAGELRARGVRAPISVIHNAVDLNVHWRHIGSRPRPCRIDSCSPDWHIATLRPSSYLISTPSSDSVT
jgi:glycosyltransferase involved in cell wall biosynthesis